MYQNYYHTEFNNNRMLRNMQNMVDARYAEILVNRRLTAEDKLRLKIDFNDISMREFGLDIDENDHIYDMDTETILVINDKFIKYSEDEFPVISHNEIDLNLIENPRLMEIIFGHFIVAYANRENLTITSNYQSNINGSDKGIFVVTYIKDDSVHAETQEIKSDAFVNESLRIFNLVTKINHRSHLYKDLSRFDIPIVRKGK